MHKCLTQNPTYKSYVLDMQYFISRVIRLGVSGYQPIGLWVERLQSRNSSFGY